MIKYTVEVDNDKNIFWYKEGTDILHREDGPAIEFANGEKRWFLEGKYHREDGPARECANGNKEWYKEGKRHREDGPAIEHVNGTKYWYKEGKLHREDGPAIEFADGTKEWYLNGEEYSEEEYKNYIQNKNILSSCDGKVVEIDGKKYQLKEI